MNFEYVAILKGRIISLLRIRKGYQYIADIRIELLEPASKKRTCFDEAYQSLVACGRIQLCGNQIKLIESEAKC